ncbi:MAG: class I tRNA ligase family protein, partial [Pseudomonadota bacterium]
VTTEAGTGAVHTAPAHGVDDFAVGKRYDLPVNNPVGSNGTYLNSTDIFAGQFVFKANSEVVQLLDDRGVLLKHEDYHHSYPHCWRHKTPILYRATSQWFIGMDRAVDGHTLRSSALAAIKEVDWEPDWGQARIETMVENRPDWCISRQRNWGVPIAVFLHKESGELHPNTPALMEQVAKLIEKSGIQAWYDLDPVDLLGDDADQYDKVTDTLDVWFDSGVTHRSVVSAREELPFPADLYLEGSDQHRGWFQSSLMTSVAVNAGVAPYRSVLTHGFVVDEKGHKMSKSLGNVIAPQEVINSLGADILRLWVASTDYRAEVSLSNEILQRTGDSYRRIRNTARYLLGNLDGFDANKNLLPYDELLAVDQWAVRLTAQMQADIEAAYETFQFHQVYQRLHRFCVVEMGGFYLDVIKDRLYTMQTKSHGRLSAQTAMHHILETLVRLVSPILSFTAEEIWSHMSEDRGSSVLFEESYTGLADIPKDTAADEKWDLILTTRNEVAKQIEALRNAGQIGAALDAGVRLYAGGDLYHALKTIEPELKFVFITSGATLGELDAAPQDAVATDVEQLKLKVEVIDHDKCVRCWHRDEAVGTDSTHSELCPRCISNVDGAGESRQFV